MNGEGKSLEDLEGFRKPQVSENDIIATAESWGAELGFTISGTTTLTCQAGNDLGIYHPCKAEKVWVMFIIFVDSLRHTLLINFALTYKFKSLVCCLNCSQIQNFTVELSFTCVRPSMAVGAAVICSEEAGSFRVTSCKNFLTNYLRHLEWVWM